MSARQSAEKGALDAPCSQCGEPFREHGKHIDPTERGGLRFSMTCPTRPAKTDGAS